MKKLMRPQVLIPVAALAILLLWFFTPPIVVFWVDRLSIDPSRYGAFGDLFGALNSLFTGLAMVGVFLVLYLDGRARRAEKPPVLAPEIRSVSYTPVKEDGVHRVSLKVDYEMSNVGTSPAFNWIWTQHELSIGGKTLKAQDPSPKRHAPPIPGLSQPEKGTVTLELVGDSARTVAEALERSEEVRMHFGLEYSGVGTEKWATNYSLKVKPDEGVSESLSGAVRLTAEVIPGTWYTGKPR